jgi:succinate dehydrogenase / fumarate reductase membrane anchor subunit
MKQSASPPRRYRSKAATQHFHHQRLSSIALALLVPWFVGSAFFVIEPELAGAEKWMQSPINALLLCALAAAAAYHMRLGMEVIAGDYIRGRWLSILRFLNTLGACMVVVVVAGALLIIHLA